MANDIIVMEGSLGREMFFLVNGNVDVTSIISPLMADSVLIKKLKGTRVRDIHCL